MLIALQRLLSRDRSINGKTDKRLLLFKIRQQGIYPALALPALLLMVLFFIIPLVRMVDVSFGGNDGFSLAYYDKALTNPIYRRMFRTTFELAAFTTVGCIALGYPIAYFLATRTGRWHGAVLLIAIIPFITNSIASVYSWRVIFGRRGPINEFLQFIGVIDKPLEILWSRFAVEVGMIQILLPFMILPLYAVMRSIPKSLTAVAESMGAHPLKSFRHIFLPLSLPGIWAGSILVFILSAGSAIAPSILGGIRDQGIASYLAGTSGFSAALAVILLTAILILYMIFARLVGFGSLYGAGEALLRSSPIEISYRAPRRISLNVMVGAVCIFLVLPSLIVIPLAFNESSFVIFPPKSYSLVWIKTFFTTSVISPVNWVESTFTSLQLAFITVLVSVPAGGLVAYGIARGSFPGRGFLGSFIILPLIIPSTLTAIALFYFYSFHMRILVGTVIGIAMPHAVLAIPYVVIILTATLRGVDEVHEHAAMSLGANRFTAFRRVILPQIVPGITVATFFAFMVSFYEVPIAVFLKDPFLRTLPMNLWNGVTVEFAPMMAAVSFILLIFAAFMLIGLVFFRSRLFRQRT